MVKYVIGGLVVCILIMGISILLILKYVKFLKEQNEENTKELNERWQRKTDEEIRKMEDKSKHDMVLLKDRIQGDKEKLAMMDEKELLVETMVSIGKLARRMDRIEETVGVVKNYKTSLQELSNYRDAIVSNCKLFEDKFIAVDNEVAKVLERLNAYTNSLEDIDEKLKVTEEIKNRIEENSNNLADNIGYIDNVQNELQRISTELNESIHYVSESPVSLLQKMEGNLKQVNEKMDEIGLAVSGLEEEVKATQAKEAVLGEKTLSNVEIKSNATVRENEETQNQGETQENTESQM